MFVTSSRAVVSKQRKIRYEQEIRTLNDKIQNLLTEIQNNANTFIKDHFYDGQDVIRITLNFYKRFKFDNIRNDLWGNNRDVYRHNQLHIKLTVEVFDETCTSNWRKIERVQSFLNEANLTRIANYQIWCITYKTTGSAV